MNPKSLSIKTLFVSVSKLWRIPNSKGIVAPDCDYARGCWRLNNAKANQCELLMAVDHKVIVGVWRINKVNPIWESVAVRPIPARDMFSIDHKRKVCEVQNVSVSTRKRYIGQQVRMYGPIRYSF